MPLAFKTCFFLELMISVLIITGEDLLKCAHLHKCTHPFVTGLTCRTKGPKLGGNGAEEFLHFSTIEGLDEV